MLTFTKDKEIPFVEIIDFHLPSDFPTTLLVAIVGVAEETYIPGAAEEGFWVSVTRCCCPGEGGLQATHYAGWSPDTG